MRTQTIEAVFEQLRAELGSDVTLSATVPGDGLHQRHVFLHSISDDGEFEYPVAAGGQWYRDDMFSFHIGVYDWTPGAEPFQVMRRVETMWFDIERALFGADGFQTEVRSAVSDGAFLSAEVRALLGPNPEPTEEGWVAHMDATVLVHGRLHSTR